MSGYDVGGVVSANLGLRRDPDGMDPQAQVIAAARDDQTPVVRIKHFMDFLERFTSDDDSELPYREQLLAQYDQGEYFIVVDMDNLRDWDVKHNRCLVEWLHHQPAESLAQFSTAAMQVVHAVKHTQDQQAMAGSPAAGSSSFQPNEESMERVKREIRPIQIQLVNFARHTQLRELQASDVAKLVSIRGIVVSAGRAQVKATSLTIMCRNCRDRSSITTGAGFGSIQLPRQCRRSQELQQGQAVAGQFERCPIDPYMILADSSTYIDQQRLKLQELPELVPTGQMPRHLSLSAEQYLVDRCKPGMRVTVVGIYTTFQAKQGGGGGDQGGARDAGIRVPYLRVLGIEQENSAANEVLLGGLEPHEEEEIVLLAQTPNLYERIAKSIAPAIFGSEDIKKAIAIQLFGGSRKLLPDGMRLRGDINVLLLGDPSVAKSQFLKFASRMAPISVYTSGKGSSAAGLTASVLRDPGTGEFHLEGGALVLADGGLVCIDEFDKMREQDRVAIHEAMEQQTISIAKAGITTILNSRTSVLAAANPKFGRYNDLKTPGENIEFQTTILSRFDLIFIVRDLQNEARDTQLAKHIVSVHQKKEMALDAASREDLIDAELLKRYIAYARARCFPRLSEEAGNRLKNRYVNFRAAMRKIQQETRAQERQNNPAAAAGGNRPNNAQPQPQQQNRNRDGGDGDDNQDDAGNRQNNGRPGQPNQNIPQQKQQQHQRDSRGNRRSDKGTIPITVRQLEAIIRLSEALARMELKDVATADHVNEALRLFKVSTFQAATSNLGEAIVGSPEFEAKVRKAESHLERRVAIGSSVAYSSMLREMIGAGHNENAVVRAVHNLLQRQKFRAYNQGKMLNRVRA